MATKYCVGTPWSASASWAATSGGAGGTGVPTAADDVILDALSPSLTLDVAGVCRSFDCVGGTGGAYTATFTHGAFNLTAGTTTVNGTLAVRFSAAMTYTATSATLSILVFNSTSATQIQFTSAGKTLGSVTFQGAGGSWLLADGFTTATTGVVTHTAGTINTNAQPNSWGGYLGSGATTRVVTITNSYMTITGVAATGWGWLTSPSGGLTINAAGSTIDLANGNFHCGSGGFTFNNVILRMPNIARSLGGNPSTFVNLTLLGTGIAAAITMGGHYITGTFTAQGGAPGTQQMTVTGAAPGITAPVSAEAVAFQNVTFMDIQFTAYAAIVRGDGANHHYRMDGANLAAGVANSIAAVDNGFLTALGTYTYGLPGLLANDPDTAMAFGSATLSYADVKTGRILLGLTNFAVDLWFQTSTLPASGFGVLYSERDASGNDLFVIRLTTTGDLNIAYRDTAGTLDQHGTSLDNLCDGQKHHVAVSKNGTAWTVWIDGVSKLTWTQTATNTFTGVNTHCRMGCDTSTPSQYVGTLDEVALYPNALTAAQALEHYQSGAGINTYSSIVTADVPVAYWRLGETTGSTAVDVMGAHNGTWATALGAGHVGSVAGAIAGDPDGGVTLDNSVNAYAQLGNVAAYQVSNGTYEALIKTTDTSANYHSILSKTNAVGFFVNAGSLHTYDWGATADRNSSVFVADGNWHHVAMTFQSGVTNGTIIYLDGLPVFTTTITVLSQGSVFNIGASSGAQFWNGSLDEVAFYNYVLTPGQIIKHYGATLSPLAAAGISVGDAQGNAGLYPQPAIAQSWKGGGSALDGTKLVLTGVTGEVANTPDANVLDITGDIDLRVKIQIPSATPATAQYLMSKFATSNLSFQFFLNTNGRPGFQWTQDGVTAISQPATAAIPNAGPIWIRVTLQVNNGAGGSNTIFYTSTDGITWTQLGTTVTRTGVTSIFSGTGALYVGSSGASIYSTGSYYRAQMYNGIAGTLVFDADFTAPAAGANTFTEAANGATVQINVAGGNWSDATKWSGGKTPLPQDTTTVSKAFLLNAQISWDIPGIPAADFTGTIGLLLAKAASPNSLYGSLTLSPTMTWSGSQVITFAGRQGCVLTAPGLSIVCSASFTGAGGVWTLGSDISILGTGISHNYGDLNLNGHTFNCLTYAASLLTGPGSIRALRFQGGTLMCNGTGNVFLVGQTSPTYSTDQTGTIVVAGADYGAKTVSTPGMALGGLTFPATAHGVLLIQGTNTWTKWAIGAGSAMTITAGTTQTVRQTLTATGAPVVNGPLILPGVASEFASTPNSAAISITGDIDIRCRCALTSWTVLTQSLVDKFGSPGAGNGNRAYCFRTHSTVGGRLELLINHAGAIAFDVGSTVAVPFTAGQAGWTRVTYASATGTVLFYTANGALTNPAPGDWVQLGASVSTVATTIDATTHPLLVGADPDDSRYTAGTFYRAQVLNGIAGTPVFDADFTTKAWGANTLTEAANGATVTINGGNAQASDGRVQMSSSTPGTAWNISLTGPEPAHCDYLVLQDSHADGSVYAPYAGSHSIDRSNNTRWQFRDAPPYEDLPTRMVISPELRTMSIRADPKSAMLLKPDPVAAMLLKPDPVAPLLLERAARPLTIKPDPKAAMSLKPDPVPALALSAGDNQQEMSIDG